MSGAAASVATDLLRGLVVSVPLLLLVEAVLWLAILTAWAAESGVGAFMGWCHTMVQGSPSSTTCTDSSCGRRCRQSALGASQINQSSILYSLEEAAYLMLHCSRGFSVGGCGAAGARRCASKEGSHLVQLIHIQYGDQNDLRAFCTRA